MKFYKLLLTFALSWCFMFINAQTIDGTTCTSLEVTSTPGIGQTLFNVPLNTGTGGPCVATIGGNAYPMKVRYYLQMQNPSTGNFTNVGGLNYGQFQYLPNFSGLSKGTYRVMFEIPMQLTVPQCKNGFVEVFNTLGQKVGRVGTFIGAPTLFSNPIPIGAPTASDISYTFIDIPETGSEQAYDYGETVIMNASACTNYDQWNLAVFESGPTYNRFRSNGWTVGTLNQFNISNLWSQYGWQFEPFHSYRVQFATQNSSCPTWNNLDRTFFICPAGSGCKFGIDDKEILLSPNPASTFIKLEHFNPDIDLNYHLTITDLSGKTVRQILLQSNLIDISDLPNGMFVVGILKDDKQVFNSKLVVNH